MGAVTCVWAEQEQEQGQILFTNWANDWSAVALGGGNGIMKLVHLNLKACRKVAAQLLRQLSGIGALLGGILFECLTFLSSSTHTVRCTDRGLAVA